MTPLATIAHRFSQIVDLPAGKIDEQIRLIEEQSDRDALRALLKSDRTAQRVGFLTHH